LGIWAFCADCALKYRLGQIIWTSGLGRLQRPNAHIFSELFPEGNRMNVHSLIKPRVSRSFLSASALLLLGSLLSVPSAQAQANGYDFGIGWGFAQPPVRFTTPREDLPYFAKFPPVYYGDMVRRPYGYSPYALPPGIEPVEQRIIQQSMGPRTVMNPFFERPAAERRHFMPAPALPPAAESTLDAAPPAVETPVVEPPAAPAEESPSTPAIDDRDVAA
jgi:hypothetical protein